LAIVSASASTPQNASAPSRLAARLQPVPIGECEPGIRIVDEADAGAVAAALAEFGDARADQAEIEKRRGGARPAIENECHRPISRRGIHHIRSIKYRGGALTGLIE
jgi:hypothetical protein